MTGHSPEENFEHRDFEKPGLLFRFCLAVIHPLITGPRLYSPFVEGLELEGNERILEFGCGNGVFMTYLADSLNKRGSAIGVDTSSWMVEKARARLRDRKNVEILRGDVRTMDLEPGSFGLVTFIHVLHDIKPEERQGTVNALSILIAEGGRLCMMEPVSKSHGMPLEEIRSIMTSAGLIITEEKKMGRRVRVSCVKPGGRS